MIKQEKNTLFYLLWLSQTYPNACLLVVCTVFKKYYYHGRTGDSYLEKARTDAIPSLGINTTFLMNSSVSRSMSLENQTGTHDVHYGRETAVLSLMLMLGTLWLGHTLYQFKKRWVTLVLELRLLIISYYLWEINNGLGPKSCNPVKTGGTLPLVVVEAKTSHDLGWPPGKC